MTVYEDFLAYVGGVYVHKTGAVLGGHLMKIFGWGTENGIDYWLFMNSWNNGWGINGTIKIKQGDCGTNLGVFAGKV